MTSFEMTIDERARLARLATQRRASLGSVLRRGVVLVDEVDEALSPAEGELLAQLAANGTSLADVIRLGLAATELTQTQEADEPA